MITSSDPTQLNSTQLDKIIASFLSVDELLNMLRTSHLTENWRFVVQLS